MSDLLQILQRPVPDFTAQRQALDNFRKYPLQKHGQRADERLVDISLYGLAGQAYYSRPNGATGEPLPDVPKEVLLRESIAERLAAINYALQASAEVTEFFGGAVELYVNEGYRSSGLQKHLYTDVFPALIRTQHPELDDKQVRNRRDNLVAAPPRSDSPSPHATGAAVDVRLRYQQANLGFVPNGDVLLATKTTQTNDSVWPDYFEHAKDISVRAQKVQRNRRAFYWIMRGALLGDDSGFVVNPNEWWHWSYGDQMWAQLTNAPEAFFAESKLVI